MCEVFPVIWNVGFRKNITRVINAVFKKKDDPEAQELFRFVRPNAKWSKSPEPVVLIDPDTGEEFVDFPEETIPERIRKVLDSFSDERITNSMMGCVVLRFDKIQNFIKSKDGV